MTATLLLDGSPMGGGISGAGRYAYHLLDNLVEIVNTYNIRIVVPPESQCPWDISRWRGHQNVELIVADISGAGLARQQFYLTNRFDYDLFHSLSSYLPVGIFGKSVVTIHDLKYITYDWLSSEYSRVKRAYIRTMIWNSVRRANRVISVSESTKSDLVKTFNVDSNLIVPIHLGPGKVDKTTAESPVESRYFLFVGELRPHKNLPTLIKAYTQFRNHTDSNVQLVIVGRQYDNTDPMTLVESQYRDDVHHLGTVDDETLAALYQDAIAFVFPSLYEGFGLPILEAMGYNTPVVISNRTSIPEVAGNAGLYFDPECDEDLARQLRIVAESDIRREALQQAAGNRFEDFSWEKTAMQTLSVYNEVVNSR